MRGSLYQIFLIALSVLVAALFGIFLYRELYPEYKIYQQDYVTLENFRSTYTGVPPPPFKEGIKQIVIAKKNKGPEDIDRCISCHVALSFEHFSPTKIAHNNKGEIEYDSQGIPKQVPNENYIWAKLDEQINFLRDPEINQKLTAEEKSGEVSRRLAQADAYEALKSAKVDGNTYDVTKVLAMHPLIGQETRPFEMHPIEEFGCVSCHNGNGRGLTTEKAHGPVFDETYETEYMGPTPTFLEEDAENDPQFARVFNHKPGHRLLFQTTPIFVGALIEAKCVQCHDPHSQKKENFSEGSSNDLFNVNMLTKNYQRGEELYISQACYACHRIEGLGRGGIGPDLTEEGNKYPWFIKESIVWPQADLKSSTMPNFYLDHEELEDLTAFLLAQTGQRKYESPVEHKIAIAKWEAGEKNTWEEPLKPSQVHNLDDAMTLFAKEGCAACHRLKGFKSNIGFAVEKDKNVSFETLHQEQQWFSKLFPEDLPGSQIVATIEKHQDEINSKIVDGIRTNSLLEKLQEQDPESVAQFYSNFKYAFRAKNNELKKIQKENPGNTKLIEKEKKAWHDLVQKVLMIYVQEYGLGRVIGPKPNWSGVYRSDKWLMEHFYNPSSIVRRSIMPAFPFDTTKFYALTYMLDVLGAYNRDQERKLWELEGFSPAKAYKIHCAQCHGEYLQGNGPVSEWIYPIPKSLRSADFLRNLTKEKAYESIFHGVKGTPMPSWGETSKDKPIPDNQPILTKEEIVQIVDWIFSSLPGGSIIKTSEEVPKWQYSPENVIEDLKREKNHLKALPQSPEKDLRSQQIFSFNQDIHNYYASLNPIVAVTPKDATLSVSDIFDVVPYTSTDPTVKEHFYIKKKYYTPENLKAAQEFFELNCAICHGREADGSGNRANTMVDAKPRMLTNLAWIESKDDLRILRSIKYGVPGTSMVAWGDQTSSLQRLQLAMYIRSLSEEAKVRDDLMSHIYDAFNGAQMTVEQYRIALSPTLIEAQKQLNQTQEKLSQSQRLAEQSAGYANEAVKLYQQKLEEERTVKKLESQDLILQNLIAEINHEKQILTDLGLSIIAQKQSDVDYEKYNQLIDLKKDLYSIKDGILSYKPPSEEALNEIINLLKNDLNQQIQSLKKQKFVLEGKIASPKIAEERQTITAREKSLDTLKTKISNFIEQAVLSQKKQQALIDTLNVKTQSPSKTSQPVTNV